jgi:predicted DsbA family dithiol-disulfide isomerase
MRTGIDTRACHGAGAARRLLASAHTCTHKYLMAVQDDYRAAQVAGIRSRPAFDLNGTRLVGAQPFSVFQKVNNATLTK